MFTPDYPKRAARMDWPYGSSLAKDEGMEDWSKLELDTLLILGDEGVTGKLIGFYPGNKFPIHVVYDKDGLNSKTYSLEEADKFIEVPRWTKEELEEAAKQASKLKEEVGWK